MKEGSVGGGSGNSGTERKHVGRDHVWRRVFVFCILGTSTCLGGEPAAAPQLVKGARISFSDVAGRAFKDVQITRLDTGGLSIMTGEGVLRIPADQLPKHLRDALSGTAPADDDRPEADRAAQAVIPSAAEIELPRVRADIQKLEQELQSYSKSRDAVKAEYDNKYEEVRKRYDEEFRALLYQYESDMAAVGGYGAYRHGRQSRIAPTKNDPNTHPQIILLREKLDGYQTQVADRERWLKELNAKREGLETSLWAIRRQREDEAMKADEIARQRIASQNTEAERQKAEAAKQSAEGQKRKEEEILRARRDERIAAIERARAGIDASLASGDYAPAIATLSEIVGKERADQPDGADVEARLRDVGLRIFNLALDGGDFISACASLRLALSQGGNGAQIKQCLMAVHLKVRDHIISGDHAMAVKHLPLLDIAVKVDKDGYLEHRRDLSMVALERAAGELRSCNISRAFASLDLASSLWPMNPRIRVWRLSMMGGCVVFGLVFLVAVGKLVERAYLSWPRR